MRTYRELVKTPEFSSLFATSATLIAASTVSGLALGTLVYAATGSPLLSALSMFGPSLAQLIGATTLLSAADRLPPRAVMTSTGLLFGVSTAVLAIPGLPVWAAFVVVGGQGLVSSLAGGVRYALLTQIVSQDGYLLGRSVLNMAVGIMQVCGFAAGGVLVTTLSPRGTLLAGAALYLTAAAVARFGLRRRPPRTAGRPTIAQTWQTNARLLRNRARRDVYLALWVPNGLIVGCESVFVAYAPRHAGLLFASAAAGMLAGDTLAGRFMSATWRRRLGAPLRFGLQGSGMLAMQGIGAAIAGAIAQQTTPAMAMTVMAAMSVAVTLALTPGLRRAEAQPAGKPPAEEVATRAAAHVLL